MLSPPPKSPAPRPPKEEILPPQPQPQAQSQPQQPATAATSSSSQQPQGAVAAAASTPSGGGGGGGGGGSGDGGVEGKPIMPCVGEASSSSSTASTATETATATAVNGEPCTKKDEEGGSVTASGSKADPTITPLSSSPPSPSSTTTNGAAAISPIITTTTTTNGNKSDTQGGTSTAGVAVSCTSSPTKATSSTGGSGGFFRRPSKGSSTVPTSSATERQQPQNAKKPGSSLSASPNNSNTTMAPMPLPMSPQQQQNLKPTGSSLSRGALLLGNLSSKLAAFHSSSSPNISKTDLSPHSNSTVSSDNGSGGSTNSLTSTIGSLDVCGVSDPGKCDPGKPVPLGSTPKYHSTPQLMNLVHPPTSTSSALATDSSPTPTNPSSPQLPSLLLTSPPPHNQMPTVTLESSPPLTLAPQLSTSQTQSPLHMSASENFSPRDLSTSTSPSSTLSLGAANLRRRKTAVLDPKDLHWLPTVKLVGHEAAVENEKTFTSYLLRVTVGSEDYKIWRRYNQFVLLDKKLKAEGFIEERPNIPPKRLFGNMNSDFVELRKEQLQQYISEICAKQALRNSAAFKDFLDKSLETSSAVIDPDKHGEVLAQLGGEKLKLALWKVWHIALKTNYLYFFQPSEVSGMQMQNPRRILGLDFCTIDIFDRDQAIFCIKTLVSGKTVLIKAKTLHDMEDWLWTLKMSRLCKTEEDLHMGESFHENVMLLSSRTPHNIKFSDIASLRGSHLPGAPKHQSADSHLDEKFQRNKALLKLFAEKVDGSLSGLSAKALSISAPNLSLSREIAAPNPLEEPKLEGPSIIFSSARRIKAATVDKLFDHLLSSDWEESPECEDFSTTFLFTYRSFCSPAALLRALTSGYREVGTDTTKHNLKRQSRICDILVKWFELHLYDFLEEPELTDEVLSFLDSDLSTNTTVGKLLKDTIAKQVRASSPQEKEAFLVNAPAPLIPSLLQTSGASAVSFGFRLLDMPPLEVARQLTLIDFDLFSKILPKECLNQHWAKKGKNDNAPNLLAFIHRFNMVSRWAASSIVWAEQLRMRTTLLSLLIEIAQHCEALNNFNSLVAILSGLQNSAIFRLKKTWENLPSPSLMVFERMKLIMNREGNFRNFREVISHAKLPCIPYLGVFLTDLTMIDDGNPDILPSGLINFEKRIIMSKVIKKIHEHKTVPYCLKPVPEIQQYLLNPPLLSDSEMFNMSLTWEPKAGCTAATTISTAQHRIAPAITSTTSEQRGSQIPTPTEPHIPSPSTSPVPTSEPTPKPTASQPVAQTVPSTPIMTEQATPALTIQGGTLRAPTPQPTLGGSSPTNATSDALTTTQTQSNSSDSKGGTE
ncbi:Ras guanine nucleotide exchange factor [Pelomyxa schiedti]|nr:Ras guanine nucleotide exchange factor [Pelomyxa schiedti]